MSLTNTEQCLGPELAKRAAKTPVTPNAVIAMAIVEIEDSLILHSKEAQTIAFSIFQLQKSDLDLSSSRRFYKRFGI